jgi:uncharacterized glyoxalase superfamily protein PhnB
MRHPRFCVFGFTVTLTFGDPPYYGIVRRGEKVTIHFSEREDTTSNIAPATVYVFVDDVDAIYEEYTGKGLDIFTPPEDQDWGMREFEVCDCNGHFLIIGQVAPDNN